MKNICAPKEVPSNSYPSLQACLRLDACFSGRGPTGPSLVPNSQTAVSPPSLYFSWKLLFLAAQLHIKRNEYPTNTHRVFTIEPHRSAFRIDVEPAHCPTGAKSGGEGCERNIMRGIPPPFFMRAPCSWHDRGVRT